MELIGKHVVGTKEAARITKQPILQQEQNSIQVLHISDTNQSTYLPQVEGFWISTGSEDPVTQESYILTDQVRK